MQQSKRFSTFLSHAGVGRTVKRRQHITLAASAPVRLIKPEAAFFFPSKF
jgi:hypothetical protein